MVPHSHTGKAVTREIPKYNSIGREELEAANRVINSGKLSGFMGSWCPEFFGGPYVQTFEKEVEAYFSVKFAVAVNSWTSGLIAAVGALDIEPGDEVIVPTWTMSATAMAILHWNAIPIFADIERDTFCVDPKSIIDNLTEKTRAVIAVDIFGQSCDMITISEICKKRGIQVISDSAQAPGSKFNDNWSGTQADIGGFSLNYHKHINTGEGGIVVTDNEDLAMRMKLLRNHAESVIPGLETRRLNNMVGFNFRMGEIEAAIGSEQLKKLEWLTRKRIRLASLLTEGMKDLPGLKTPETRSSATNIYYKYGMQVDPEITGISKSELIKLLRSEGIPGLSDKYVNVHRLPLFQEKIAYGSAGFPWNLSVARKSVDYRKGICPVAEELQDFTYLGLDLCEYDFEEFDIYEIINGFHKVWKSIGL